MKYVTRIAGITAVGMVLLTAGPAIAQTQTGQAGQASVVAAQSAQNFSPEKLQGFAAALGQIRDIRQSAQQKMQQAGSQGEKTQVRKQAQQDMLVAIKDSGLTLQEYNRIGHAVRSNPQLAQKVEQMQ